MSGGSCLVNAMCIAASVSVRMMKSICMSDLKRGHDPLVSEKRHRRDALKRFKDNTDAHMARHMMGRG